MNQDGFFCDELPWACFVDDGIIITKEGAYMCTFKLKPFDLAYEEESKIESILDKLNICFRYFSNGWTLYFDCIRKKREIPGFPFDENAPKAAKDFDSYRSELLSFYQTDFYLTFHYYIPDEKGMDNWIFKRGDETGVQSRLKEELLSFRDKIQNVKALLKSCYQVVDLLNSQKLLTFLHSLFSQDINIKLPPMPLGLDMYLSDVTFKARNVIEINKEVVLTASIHDFPEATHAGLFTALFDAPADFRYQVRFDLFDRETAKKSITSLRTHYMQKRKGFFGVFMEAITKEEKRVEDPEAVLLSEDAIDAEATLSTGQSSFGYCSTSLIVRDEDYKVAEKKLQFLCDIVQKQGFILKKEVFNNPSVFLGSLPGRIDQNKRKMILSTYNVAHLFPVSDTHIGTFHNKHYGELTGNYSPHIVTKSTNSPYFLNLNVGDVSHCFIMGPTGAGKSILLNTIAYQFYRYPKSKVYFFDKDKSCQYSCKNMNGVFFDLFGDNDTFRLNPFSNIDQEFKRSWLRDFICDYYDMIGIKYSQDDKNQILSALESLGTENKHSSFKDFQNAIQNMEFRDALEDFISGPYKDIFQEGDDTTVHNRFIAYEMNNLMDKGGVIVPLVLNYLFYLIEQTFNGLDPVLLILDEAWLFLDSPVFSQRLRNWLKVLRKKKVGVIMATQEVADAESSPIFSTIINACLSKIFLPNPVAEQPINRNLYYEMGLNDHHIRMLTKGRMKRDYLYVSPNESQMFSLNLDENQIELLTTLSKEYA